MFKIVNGPISFQKEQDLIYVPEAGGVVSFEGRVRNHNHNRKVKYLSYEAFEEMAVSVGEKILTEAKEKFKIIGAEAIHRVGDLQIEEAAIWVGVSAAHREEAFVACQYIVDQLKARVPIWKKEFYVDGKSEWVKCLSCAQKGIPHNDQNHFHHVEKTHE